MTTTTTTGRTPETMNTIECEYCEGPVHRALAGWHICNTCLGPNDEPPELTQSHCEFCSRGCITDGEGGWWHEGKGGWLLAISDNFPFCLDMDPANTEFKNGTYLEAIEVDAPGDTCPKCGDWIEWDVHPDGHGRWPYCKSGCDTEGAYIRPALVTPGASQ